MTNKFVIMDILQIYFHFKLKFVCVWILSRFFN